MNAGTIASVVAAGVILFSPFAPARQDGPALLARRGADDAGEHREGERHQERGGVDTTPAGTPPGTDAKALFERKCSVCHSLDRPLGRNRERKWWVETVTRMQKVNGCPLTDEEARTIIDYLATIRGPVPR